MRLVFLGTAGGRRVTFYQLRASGGILVEGGGALVHLDPGPGALVRLVEAGEDPAKLDMILVTHRHLDHSADLNTLVESRTMGGWTKGGKVVAPRDVMEGEDPVLLRYHRKNLNGVEVLEEEWHTSVNGLTIKTAMRHPHHGVETYGVVLESEGIRVGYLTDGRYRPEMGEAYKDCHLLIASTTFFYPRDMDHLSVPEVIEIVKVARPKQVVLTHFSMEMLDEGPKRAAEVVERETGVPTTAALDLHELVFEEEPGLFGWRKTKAARPSMETGEI